MGPTALGAGGALLIIGTFRALGLTFEQLDVTLLLHLTIAITVIGVPFCVDDPAYELQRTLPRNYLRTLTGRLLAALGLVYVSWIGQLLLAPSIIKEVGDYPIRGLIIEPLPFALLAVTAALTGVSKGNAGVRGCMATFVLYVACWLLPDKVALFLNPTAPGYDASRLRWLIVMVVAIVALAIALNRQRTSSAHLAAPQRR